MVSIHLPHHGGSTPIPGSGEDDRIIEPGVFNRILDLIIRREVQNAKDRTLLGYSIGGRIGLALAADRPKSWQHAVFLAPDGLKQSPFYAITVHTQLGRWAWFWMDRNEKRVWKWSDALLKWGLISKHLHGFVYFHSSSHAMRMMVWRGWRTHRGCWPSHRAIAAALERIPRTSFVFGEYDKIIPTRNASRLRRMTQRSPHISFQTVRSGHNMLKPETMEAVVRCIFGL
jgi:pimeloyl-ACP methyl ester carboxylesterase